MDHYRSRILPTELIWPLLMLLSREFSLKYMCNIPGTYLFTKKIPNATSNECGRPRTMDRPGWGQTQDICSGSANWPSQVRICAVHGLRHGVTGGFRPTTSQYYVVELFREIVEWTCSLELPHGTSACNYYVEPSHETVTVLGIGEAAEATSSDVGNRCQLLNDLSSKQFETKLAQSSLQDVDSRWFSKIA